MSATCLSMPNAMSLGTNVVTIGDTGLMDQLLGFCGLYPDGEIFLTAPYFDEHLIDRMLGNTNPEVTLKIVCRTKLAADHLAKLVASRQRKAHLYVHPRLHAKIYVFECKNRVIAALIGSHNPTRAGSKSNLEIGVFLSATCGKPEWQPIQQAREFILRSAKFIGETPIKRR
jgi:hypothetical protein